MRRTDVRQWGQLSEAGCLWNVCITCVKWVCPGPEADSDCVSSPTAVCEDGQTDILLISVCWQCMLCLGKTSIILHCCCYNTQTICRHPMLQAASAATIRPSGSLNWCTYCDLILMLNAHLPTGSRQLAIWYRQLPTENRRSSVGVYQMSTRSSALIGRCALNLGSVRLSAVNWPITVHFRARLDLATIFASAGIDYFMHFRHFASLFPSNLV